MSSSNLHWDSLQIELLHIHDEEVVPWGRRVKDIPPANYHRAWLLRDGSGRFKVGRRWIALTPGEWMVPSFALCAQEFSDDARLLSLHFRARWPDGSPLFEVGAAARWPHARHPQVESVARTLLQCCPSGPLLYGMPAIPLTPTLDQFLRIAESFRGWLRAFCAAMTAEGHVPTSPPVLDSRVRAGLHWLDQLPLSAKFREPALAAELGLSVTHLNRLFAREINQSPAAYLEQRRWERATHLLTNSSLCAKQIAYELGFCAPSYFTTWVKSRSGKTPTEFRRRD